MDERQVDRMLDRAISGLKIRVSLDDDLDLKVSLLDCTGYEISSDYIYRCDLAEILSRIEADKQ